jgi:HJR/Mrr/RecB family endonuclease
VIPVLLADCEIPPSLAAWHYIDLRRQFELGLKQLSAQLAALHDVDFELLSHEQFDALVAELLRDLGFTVSLTSRSRDGGVDFIATAPSRDALGVVRQDAWVVEVKHYRQRRVGVSVIREMLGRVALEKSLTKGLIVTNAHLTSVARDVLSAATRPTRYDLQVIDGTTLTNLLIGFPTLVSKYFGETRL